ncbi:MAG: diaminopimelate epimerase, partial [Verrucomicrobia bacterium]|nr:diaminopimelate epimerase [Verrucomicrobiota bacterium]
MLAFTKMSGAGNDFILLDNRHGELCLEREQIALLCDRHRGVGADGLLIVERPQGAADFRMRYYNQDGGEAEMCGNGARCFARYAGRLDGSKTSLNFETVAGLIEAKILDSSVQLAMTKPINLELDRTISIDDRKFSIHSVNTGVPHAVIFVENLESIDIRSLGSQIRFHRAFAPEGTNANFVQIQENGKLAIRTYERGVEGETLACGTGVVAAALLYAALNNWSGDVKVLV